MSEGEMMTVKRVEVEKDVVEADRLQEWEIEKMRVDGGATEKIIEKM